MDVEVRDIGGVDPANFPGLDRVLAMRTAYDFADRTDEDRPRDRKVLVTGAI